MDNSEKIGDFIKQKGIEVRDKSHLLCINMVAPYLYSFSGDRRKLPLLLERFLRMSLDGVEAITGCFNGVFQDDTKISPFNVDMYIKLSNGMRVFLYVVIENKDFERLNEPFSLLQNDYRIIIYDEGSLREAENYMDSFNTILIPIENINRV